MSGKETSCNLKLDFPLMALGPGTSRSDSLSKTNGDGALTSSQSVSSVTTNANLSTSTTPPATSQVAFKNRLSMMERPIPSIGKNLLKFIEGQKRPSSGNSSRQKHQSRPLQTSQLMLHNPILIKNLRNTLNRGIILRRMSHRMGATIMIWVTWLLRKQMQQCRGSKKVVCGGCFSESPYTK